jgi:hypothetical protein
LIYIRMEIQKTPLATGLRSHNPESKQTNLSP